MLEKISLFSSLPIESLNQLEQSAVVRKYPKNTLLFLEGDTSGQLFIVLEGLVCVYTDDDEGRQLVLNYLGPDEYFGELSLLDDKPRSASVMTVSDCQLLSISRETFKAFLQGHPEFYEALMVELVARVRSLTENVKDMALLDVYGRVAHTLERLCGGDDDNTRPKLTHQDIANMVGASREMVSRVMKELVVGGYIRIHQKHIHILKSFPKQW